MRRKDREVTEFSRIVEIIEQCDVCRLGLCENNSAYIVPLSFGYESQDEKITLYFHSAGKGRKLDMIRQNSNVTFEMDTAHVLYGDEATACSYGMRFQSVMGTGTARLVEDLDEKTHAFEQIMTHYVDQQYPFNQHYLEIAAIIAVTVETISCKVHA